VRERLCPSRSQQQRRHPRAAWETVTWCVAHYESGAERDGGNVLVRTCSKPLTNGFPPEAICKKLGKLDPAICELTYQKTYKFDLVRTCVAPWVAVCVCHRRVCLRAYMRCGRWRVSVGDGGGARWVPSLREL
jgi:hypothetical protein